MGSRGVKNEFGFSTLEVLLTVVVIGIMSALSIKPLSSLLQKIKLQNAADGMKHFILTARLRAVSNTERHCGVVFRFHPSVTVNDTVFAFLDASPPDNNYTKGKDSLYLRPFILYKRDKIASVIPAGYPTVIVFRGDGSATLSAKVVLTLKTRQDTVTVLASTGKVKAVLK